jgi:hypothetical protein
MAIVPEKKKKKKERRKNGLTESLHPWGITSALGSIYPTHFDSTLSTFLH